MELEDVALAVLPLLRADVGELGAVLHHLADGAGHAPVVVRLHGTDVDYEAVASDLPPRLRGAALVQGVRAPELPVRAGRPTVAEAPASKAGAERAGHEDVEVGMPEAGALPALDLHRGHAAEYLVPQLPLPQLPEVAPAPAHRPLEDLAVAVGEGQQRVAGDPLAAQLLDHLPDPRPEPAAPQPRAVMAQPVCAQVRADEHRPRVWVALAPWRPEDQVLAAVGDPLAEAPLLLRRLSDLEPTSNVDAAAMAPLPAPVAPLVPGHLRPATHLRCRSTDGRLVVDLVGVVVGDLRRLGRTGDRSLFAWSPVRRDQVGEHLVPLVADAGLLAMQDPGVEPALPHVRRDVSYSNPCRDPRLVSRLVPPEGIEPSRKV